MSKRTDLPAGLLDSLDEAITGRGGRREGRETRFLCPDHDDHHPSARWNREKAVWRCDACGAGGGAFGLAKLVGVELPAARPRSAGETIYTVCDASGRVVAEHVRTDLANGKKRMFWRRDGKKGLSGMRTAELPLYGAERVAGFDASRPVFVVEGEKAAECLRAIGAQAVATVTGAAGAPGAGPLELLRGRRVVLWPDADAAGKQHMERIAVTLAGIATSVRMFAPAGLPTGGDSVEWLEQQRRAEGKPDAVALSDLESIAASLPAPAPTACGRTVEESAGDPVEAALAAVGAAAGAAEMVGPLRQLSEALRGADSLQRAAVRAIVAVTGKVSAPAHLVDSALAVERPATAAGQGRAVAFADPAPWPEAVDGAALLQDLACTLSRYVALPAHAAEAIALWCIHSHALDAANATPILAVLSPEKRCGKTTLLGLLSRLVSRAVLSSNISPASLFRIVERYSPTLLVDEADTFLREKEELRGILNSGHTRDAAYVVRTVGDEHEPRRFSTWAAKAVAMIGRLPDTLADRSIVVPMRRRAPGEHVERLRLDRPRDFEDLRRRAARWAADHLAELRTADPEVPPDLNDRAADNWRPLLAIADLAGGKWPGQARRAALGVSGTVEAQDGTGELLLADIREIFRRREVPHIFTRDMLAGLNGRDDRSWREWRRGNSLTEAQLARLLKRFGIRPGTVRIGSETAKGYALDDFADAFNRYLPPSDPSHPSQSNAGAGLTDSPTRHSSDSVTARESVSNPYRTGIVTGVTAQVPSPGEVVPQVEVGAPAPPPEGDRGEWCFP